MNVINRIQAPTPKFFRVLRTVGLILAGISGSLIAAPVVLPATVITIAGYLAVAGGVLSAVSQVTVLNEPEPDGREPQPPFDASTLRQAQGRLNSAQAAQGDGKNRDDPGEPLYASTSSAQAARGDITENPG